MRTGTRVGLWACWFLIAHLAFGQDVAPKTDGASIESTRSPKWIPSGKFTWDSSAPLIQVNSERLPSSPEHPWVSIKDPSIVRVGDRWHLFCSLRKNKLGEGRIRIGYTSFDHWSHAADATWSVLELTPGYHGAPQIFFFEPQQTWYLIYQAEDASRGLKYGPCYSTNPDLADPNGWTLPKPLYTVPEGNKAGLDYWIICDDVHAYLFFTTLDGKMWRSRTSLDQFPSHGWSDPVIALESDIFEASHTYRIAGTSRYLTLIEAQQGSLRRYYKAFLAESLDGPWLPLAATVDHPFAGQANVRLPHAAWTESYSHGELIRSGTDQRLEVDPTNLQFLFQGASGSEYHIGNYGLIPWKLGMLTLRSE